MLENAAAGHATKKSESSRSTTKEQVLLLSIGNRLGATADWAGSVYVVHAIFGAVLQGVHSKR